ncbi:hypothetical protein BGZ74_007340 [Mortierella antarctica]|nr:hypothetical protein BGZ74_007340 [Mortierella antarctica]
MGYSFDIELDTEQPFIVELEMAEYNAQTISGAIVVKLDRAEQFKVATIAIHGHIGAMLNIDTSDQALAREDLIETTVDLIAANDTEGRGTIHLDSGEQYIPFRIDLPRSGDLPPTLINKLDTPYIDWKYEIHASLRRDYFFSATRVVKHDLVLRRPIPSSGDDMLTTSVDQPGQYRSKLSTPGRLVLGQDRLLAKAELKARSKSYMIRELDCSVIQIEDVDYRTKRGHPIANAGVPGASCQVNASRLVSSHVVMPNTESDLDFGRYTPIEFDIRLDNDQLIPTEYGLGWLQISHVLRYTIHFMDMNLAPLISEVPLFVGNEVLSKEKAALMKPQKSAARLVADLKIAKPDDHENASRASTPEAE